MLHSSFLGDAPDNKPYVSRLCILWIVRQKKKTFSPPYLTYLTSCFSFDDKISRCETIVMNHIDDLSRIPLSL